MGYGTELRYSTGSPAITPRRFSGILKAMGYGMSGVLRVLYECNSANAASDDCFFLVLRIQGFCVGVIG